MTQIAPPSDTLPSTFAAANEEADAPELAIYSEFETLRTVVVHRPGEEIDRLTPDNKAGLLFEDIPFLEQMQVEHDLFCEAMDRRGIRILYFQSLIADVLRVRSQRTRLMTEVCLDAGQPALVGPLLDACDDAELLRILFRGLSAGELEEYTGLRVGPLDRNRDFFLLPPIPNAYFMRDTVSVVGNGVVYCKPHFSARIREAILTSFVLRHHPLFQQAKVIHGHRREHKRPLTIEGGDIIVLSPDAVAIGCSERTRRESIVSVAAALFREGLATRVYEIPIPAERRYMHLDTVMTIVGPRHVLAYPGVINDLLDVRKYVPWPISESEITAHAVTEQTTLKRLLEEEIHDSVSVVHTGDNNPQYAAREQGADGTNMFAIAPNVVISYDRNVQTNRALDRQKIEVISIAGSELVRGLGGPRCMTLPLVRS